MATTLEAVEATLNAVKDIVSETRDKIDEINGSVDDHETRLALVEQKQDQAEKGRGVWVHLAMLVVATVLGGVILLVVNGGFR